MNNIKIFSFFLFLLAADKLYASLNNIYDPTSNTITINAVRVSQPEVATQMYRDVQIKNNNYLTGQGRQNCTPISQYSSYDFSTNTGILDVVVVKGSTPVQQYCDVTISNVTITSSGYPTPVEVFTNTFNPSTNLVTVDSIGYGYNLIYGANFNTPSSFLTQTQTSFFNFITGYPGNGYSLLLHSITDLGSGMVIDQDFTGVASNVNSPNPPVNSSNLTTTVLVYILGTDLESDPMKGFMSQNIAEMTEVGSTSNTNVIVQTGGAKNASIHNFNLPIDWKHVQRWKVGKYNPNNASDRSQAITMLQDLGTEGQPGVDQGNPQSLQNFIQWGVKTYPADKFVLIMGAHSGGINGYFSRDENTGSEMSIPGIIGAVATAQQTFPINSSGIQQKIELLAFDSCLNGSLEIAAGLQPYVNYLVASEDEQAGAGLDYRTLLQQIAKYPNYTGKEIGIAMVGSDYLKNAISVTIDGSTARYTNIYGEERASSTMSLIDLSKMPGVTSALNELAASLSKELDGSTNVGSWMKIAQARAISKSWSEYVDAIVFATNLQEKFPSPSPIYQAAKDLISVLEQAVLYNKASTTNLLATGLHLYFPSQLYSYPFDGYTANTSINGVRPPYENYLSFLTNDYYTTYWNNLSLLVSNIGNLNAEKGNVSASISAPLAQSLAAGFDNGICKCYRAITGNVIVAPTNISFRSTSQWPALFGKFVNMLPISGNNSTYSGYIIPAQLKRTVDGVASTDNGFLQVECLDGVCSVYGFNEAQADSDSFSYVDATPIDIESNDTIVLGYIQSANATYYDTNNTFTVTDPSKLVISYQNRDSSVFSQFSFITTDLTGNRNITSPIPF